MTATKVIVISAAVSANIIIWHDIFGPGFLVVLGLVLAVAVLIPGRWRK